MHKLVKRILMIDVCLLLCIFCAAACTRINSLQPFDAEQATIIIHSMYSPNCFAHPQKNVNPHKHHKKI